MANATFAMRPAQEADREAVLTFCRQTWDWGDYLEWVWDDWLAHPRGMFAVATVDGRVMGVDKLTFLSADEAFFEGLRVDPAYRGQGYAARMEEFMLAEAARQGARVVRLLTAIDNTPVHKNAERHGFRRGPALIPWRRESGVVTDGPAIPLVPLIPDPTADNVWAGLDSGPLWVALEGLFSAFWHVQRWTPQLWRELLSAGRLLVPVAEANEPARSLVALLPEQGDSENVDVWLAWIAAPPFDAETIAALLRGAAGYAPLHGDGVLRAMWPSVPALDAGLQAAGWTGDPAHALVVFEKQIISDGAD